MRRRDRAVLCPDHDLPADCLLQAHLDRWQIEVNHREIKDTFGVGDAQVRSENSVARHPAFAVAAYRYALG